MRILGVNPHFYDFSAFDFWAKPLGFLYLIAILKNLGFEVDFIDCLDRGHPALSEFSGKFKNTGIYGTGGYYFQKASKPGLLGDVPLNYKRYGLPEIRFRTELSRMAPPDLVLVTSGMTYWYPGVRESIKIIREFFPGVPVVLGGTYATLLPEHARRESGADVVFEGGRLAEFFDFLEKSFGPMEIRPPRNFSEFPGPDFSYYRAPAYAVIKTSEGCPFDCSYCGVKKISPEFIRKSPEKIVAEIAALSAGGIRNLAFYDDALLWPPDFFENLLSEIKKRNFPLFFHASNGIHARLVTAGIARLMKENNFILPRLSLETSNPEIQQATGGKVTGADFEKALEFFWSAGYRRGEIGAYLLMGLPGQPLAEVEKSIRYAAALGARITLAEFSPVPGTADFEKSGLKDVDPLRHNNSIYPLFPRSMWPGFQKMKDLVKEVNKKNGPGHSVPIGPI